MRSASQPYRLPGWFCLCTIIALTACSIGTHSSIPTYQPQGQFSVPGEEVLPDRWWLTFADPTLDRLIESALRDNLSLQTAWDRLDQARALARRAGAGLWPEVNGEVSGSRTRFRTNSQTESRNNFSLGLSASYEVDLWGRINSTQEAAELDAMASAELLQAAALTLTARVASTWFRLIEQRQQILLLQQQLATNLKTLELVTLQFRTGQVSIADLLQQRLVVENRRGELALAKAQEQVLLNQLAVLLGLPPDRAPQLATASLGSLPTASRVSASPGKQRLRVKRSRTCLITGYPRLPPICWHRWSTVEDAVRKSIEPAQRHQRHCTATARRSLKPSPKLKMHWSGSSDRWNI